MKPELNRVLPDGAIDFGGGIIGPSSADIALSNSQTEPLQSSNHGTRNTIFEAGALLGTIVMVDACSPSVAPTNSQFETNLPIVSNAPTNLPVESQSQEPSPSASNQTSSKSPDASPSNEPSPSPDTQADRMARAKELANQIIHQPNSEIKTTNITAVKDAIKALWNNPKFKAELVGVADANEPSGKITQTEFNLYANTIANGLDNGDNYKARIDTRIQQTAGFIDTVLNAIVNSSTDADLDKALLDFADLLYDYGRTGIPLYPGAPKRNIENLNDNTINLDGFIL